MTVILPGQQPRTIVTQGGVPMTVIGDGNEGGDSMTTPATSEAASAKEPTEAAVVNEWEKYPPGKLAPRDLTETTIGMSSSMGALVYAYDDASTAAFGCFAGAAVQTWQSAGVEAGPCVNLGGVQGATRSGFGA
jgi:hypothetical protein